MRISHNISAMNTYRQYNTNTVATNRSMEKLSSGYRINRAADDAAGLSISEKMRSQIKGLTQATRNAQDGVSYLQTAEGALNEVSDMLVRLKELSVQVQNGTYSTTDQANIGSEMSALGTAIEDIFENTKFNGIEVFKTDTTIAYGEGAGQEITIDDATLAASTSTVDDVYSLVTDTKAANNNYTNAVGIESDEVEAAITQINTLRASYGAQQNQLEHAANNMSTTKENLQAAESRIRDVDMAEEMMSYTKNNILLQAAQAMLAQANAQPQGVLQLLQ